MDRTQATDIARHLHDAAAAMDRAGTIIADLDQPDRAALADPLGEIVSALHFGLLRAIYDRYPDLRPPSDEESSIDSTLQWADVVLPKSVSQADLDELIFSALKPNWQKTAQVIGNLAIRCKALAWPIDLDVLSARIQALAESGSIEGVGDLRAWRHSEVRLTGR
ncbi:DUF3658 domain-containing protein [Bradyrhizobium sp. AUGA SZCCT0431]|uniref:DUF3658 domain-containing protein n=1 Tax=Bradyrhizobium sp. AUGA SZCCT0431 TaxID=2807674 RepID=UPI001BA8D70D|nr:DUF3658 domain-containing protein [Bradyrhizobium sp. AUGA SZCCT0431]MBR1144950.1 hypothetical protein [Bradyrhizobium sp. AUGA SZCCT0431]